MITTLLLIRHGQTESNINGHYMGRSQEDLNQNGYEQVQLLSKRLTNEEINAVYTSPLTRARITAKVVAKPHQINPIEMDDLTEINLGDWQGLHASEIVNNWPDMWQQSRVDPSMLTWPNGESFAQVIHRSVYAFQLIVKENLGKTTAIITHDIIIRIMVMYALGVSYSTYRRMEIGNASLTKIVVFDSKNQVVTLNDTSHLGQ